MRKLKLYIAMSLDGYIAKKDDNLDFLSVVESPNEDYGYADFIKHIDTIIMGRKTFDKVRSFGQGIPHKDKNLFIASKRKKGKEAHASYIDDVVKLVKALKQEPGKDIYCDGGAEVIFELLNSKLIDEIILSIIPHLLGDGIRLFLDGYVEQHLFLKKVSSFPSGLTQLHYLNSQA